MQRAIVPRQLLVLGWGYRNSGALTSSTPPPTSTATLGAYCPAATSSLNDRRASISFYEARAAAVFAPFLLPLATCDEMTEKEYEEQVARSALAIGGPYSG